MNRHLDPHSAPAEALEARLAARLAAGLNERAAALPHDVSERLRAGREQALARASQVAAAAAAPTVVATAPRLVIAGGGGFWLRVASWLPLALLVGGLVLIHEWTQREQVMAAAEIDAVLLADDLPPTAWTDPGFREYLRTPRP